MGGNGKNGRRGICKLKFELFGKKEEEIFEQWTLLKEMYKV